MKQVIVDIGSNHGGKRDELLALVETACLCGADMVKLQIFDPQWMIDHGRPECYKHLGLKDKWIINANEICDRYRKKLFASVFSKRDIERVSGLMYPIAWKIASSENKNKELIHAVCNAIDHCGNIFISHKNEITPEDLTNGYEVCITAMLCIPEYPAKVSDYEKEKEMFFYRWGYGEGISDHTLPTEHMDYTGFDYIEKHFTLSREIDTPDASFSILPHELVDLCKRVH